MSKMTVGMVTVFNAQDTQRRSLSHLHEGRFRDVISAIVCSVLDVSVVSLRNYRRYAVPEIHYDDVWRRIVTLEVPRSREVVVRSVEVPVIFCLK